MRYLAVFFSLIFMASATIAPAKADKRVAFVVGNGAYKNVAQLPNPPIDAKAMAAVLRNVGFDVVEGTNLTRDTMTQKLLDFGKRAQGADVAVFFYAGHGIAISGTNYLLPVDADIKSEMDVKLGAAINIDLTLDQTMGDAKVKLVFLDACRDNPFAAKIKSNATRSVSVQQGLAEMKSGEGTLIAFATGPGQTALDGEVGTNSPFTRALIAHVTQPGVEIQQAMTEVRAQVNEETNKGQLPWGHTNLIGAVYLNPAAAPAPTAAAPASPAAAPATTASTNAAGNDVELEFWRSVKDSNKPEELNAYVTNYPNGQFKSLALARIAALENGPSTATRNLTPGIDPATFTEDASQVTDRARQGPAPRRAAAADWSRLRRQGQRQVRRRNPVRDQALADRPRLSRHRLSEQAAAQGAAQRDRRDRDDERQRRSSTRRSAARPSSGGGTPAPAQRGGGDAGAAFIGGMMGGMMGGMFHR